jgi:hypothetical protein
MTTQDRAGTRDIAPPPVAFRTSRLRRRPDCIFSELNTQPTYPLFTLRSTPHGALRKTRGRVVRYSFLVGLFHSLLHAGLARRTEIAISRQLSETEYGVNVRIPDNPLSTNFGFSECRCLGPILPLRENCTRIWVVESFRRD